MSASGNRPDPRRRAGARAKPPRVGLQFLIALAGTQPLVWRRILVPADYSFWDLHVAIQDAMGWKDRHLHEFEIAADLEEPPARIGIPDDDPSPDHPRIPGWEVSIGDAFRVHGQVARYLYDFGDDWAHAVIYEGVGRVVPGARLPACIAGSGACPPEDSGGPPAYAELLRALDDPAHPERDAVLEWVGDSFDRNAFDPATVKFSDPRARWRRAFENDLGP